MTKQSFSKAALHKKVAQLKRYRQFLPFEQRRLDILNTAVKKAAQRVDFFDKILIPRTKLTS